MVMLTTQERLAKIRRQIEELAANAQKGAAETAARRRRQLDELRRQERATQAAARRAEEGSTEFEQFQARLRVAESTVAADVAETREAFAEAVEDELHNWDNYLERLQAQAVLRAASARE
jgi:tRNA U34 5-carboxymethylaminomethyl modifying GTPase MnmE/TrmE